MDNKLPKIKQHTRFLVDIIRPDCTVGFHPTLFGTDRTYRTFSHLNIHQIKWCVCTFDASDKYHLLGFVSGIFTAKLRSSARVCVERLISDRMSFPFWERKLEQQAGYRRRRQCDAGVRLRAAGFGGI